MGNNNMLVKLPLGSEFYTADGKLRNGLKLSLIHI